MDEHILPCCLLYTVLRAVEQRMLWDSWHSHNVNNMIHATYMSSQKESALGLPQLGLRYLSDSNSWNVNGTTNLELWGGCSRVLSQLDSDNVFVQLSVLFQLGYYEPNFKYQIFYFHVYGNLIKENIMQLTNSYKKLLGESLSHKSFSGKFGVIWAKFPLHPHKHACHLHLWFDVNINSRKAVTNTNCIILCLHS